MNRESVHSKNMRFGFTAPGSGQRAVMSEEVLLERDVAVHGEDADHLKAQTERGDTVIQEETLEEARVVSHSQDGKNGANCRLSWRFCATLSRLHPTNSRKILLVQMDDKWQK